MSLIWLFAVALIGCAIPTDALPDGAAEYHPGPLYQTWWALTEQCSGLSGDLNAVRWYGVTTPTVFNVHGEADAEWFPDNRVVVPQQHQHDGPVVRHEMLHALLRSVEHPVAYYGDRCAGVVAFDSGFAMHPTPSQVHPDASSPVLPPDSLLISPSVLPQPLHLVTADSGWLTIVVTLQNPRDMPVWIRMTRMDSSTLYYRSISYQVIRPAPYRQANVTKNDVIVDSLVAFGPREIRRAVYDEGIGPLAGIWTLSASFNTSAPRETDFSAIP